MARKQLMTYNIILRPSRQRLFSSRRAEGKATVKTALSAVAEVRLVGGVELLFAPPLLLITPMR